MSLVPALFRPATSAAPTDSTWHYLRWRAGQQPGLLIAGILLGIVNALTQAAAPFILGQVLDGPLEQGVKGPLLMWSAILLALWVLRAVTGVLAHTVDVAGWLRACLGTIHLLARKVTGTGDSLRREVPTGEVIATVASDSPRIGEVYSFVGRFVGNIVAYVAVALLLVYYSVPLGLLVLIGVPIVASLLAFVVRPLQKRQAAQREENGKLTVLASDTVAGLRILRGIGGEDEFNERYQRQSQRVLHAGVKVAGTQSILDALQTLIPGLFLAAVLWYGARLAITGDILVGQFAAFFGYAAFLTMPLSSATQGVSIYTRARIAVQRVQRVLTVAPGVKETRTVAILPARGDVEDPASGLRVPFGRSVALVAADPDVSAALATRLGRFSDDDDTASPSLGGVPLRDAAIEDVRKHVVVSEATPTLFSGTLADELDPRSTGAQEAISRALHVADAGDVLDSIGGLQGHLAERGRTLSGGQRQRVALARALMTDAEVLVLVEPTSAVDAHTEARIASRLVAERANRTTIVVTASPLVLDQVDEVVLLDDAGHVRASGRHHTFMADAERAARGELTGEDAAAAIAYRRIVSRSVDDYAPAETPGEPVLERDAHDTLLTPTTPGETR